LHEPAPFRLQRFPEQRSGSGLQARKEYVFIRTK
jgi:hypothetical protein